MKVFDAAKAVYLHYHKAPCPVITPKTVMGKDLHFDDVIDKVEFMLNIEKAFNIHVDDNDYTKLANKPLSKWIKYVQAVSKTQSR